MSMTPFSDDNEIAEAEIVEDGIVPFPLTAEAYAEAALLLPEEIPLDYGQRMLIRTALAFYADKGPRERRTRLILDLLQHMADYEPITRCDHCEGTGKVRTMYDLRFCHCPTGIRRRSAEG